MVMQLFNSASTSTDLLYRLLASTLSLARSLCLNRDGRVCSEIRRAAHSHPHRSFSSGRPCACSELAGVMQRGANFCALATKATVFFIATQFHNQRTRRNAENLLHNKSRHLKLIETGFKSVHGRIRVSQRSRASWRGFG